MSPSVPTACKNLPNFAAPGDRRRG